MLSSPVKHFCVREELLSIKVGLLSMLILKVRSLRTPHPSVCLRDWLTLSPGCSLSEHQRCGHSWMLGPSDVPQLIIQSPACLSLPLVLIPPHHRDSVALILGAGGTLSCCRWLLSFSVNSSHPHFVSSSQPINHSPQNLGRLPTVPTPGPRYHVARDQVLTNKRMSRPSPLHPPVTFPGDGS